MLSRETTQEIKYPPTLPPMLDTVDLDALQQRRLPFVHLEAQIVRAVMAEPNVLSPEEIA